MKLVWVLIVLLSANIMAVAQDPMGDLSGRFRGIKNAGAGNDSLARRDKYADSITITYRYLDTTRSFKIDSSINDLTKYYPIPGDYYYLGNFGNAAKSYLFTPNMNAGWDAGFHAFDNYKFTIDNAKFYTTTRPYSEISYMLGPRSEQFIQLMHTQNRNPNWNIHFEYRLLNSPGMYQNQKTAHNSYLITNWAHSVNKRYNNYFMIVANKLQNSENGGLLDGSYIDSTDFTERSRIQTKLGGDNRYNYDFFNTDIATGNKYADFNALMRQQYDFGRKDSIVTDSTVIPLFFPRVRLEHTIQYSKYTYLFTDAKPSSDYYADYYNLHINNSGASVLNIRDDWRELNNDFSIYTFPDEKNTQQFIKLGAGIQNIHGDFSIPDNGNYVELIQARQKGSYYNIFGHGEYRNRTKNQRWDMMAYGKFYFAGINAADFQVGASIYGLLGKKVGSVKLGFENTNRTPSFIAGNPVSSFYLMQNEVDLKKENVTHLYAHIFQPLIKLNLSGHYYLMTNYVYYTDFYDINQASSLFNVLQITANKVFEAGRKKQWKWHADIYFQQVLGNGPVNLPTIFTRNRLGYEGNLGFPNLTIAMGFEAKYRTNYKADNYSPVLGQFFYQDQQTVKYKLPDIAAYINFRINSFKAFVRAENLNTFRKLGDSWGFTNNNFMAPDYAYPGLLIRFGIFWGFVN